MIYDDDGKVCNNKDDDQPIMTTKIAKPQPSRSSCGDSKRSHRMM